MDEIFLLVGKIVKSAQELEQILEYFIYKRYNLSLEEYGKLLTITMGKKIKQIEENENDTNLNTILKYLTKQRNYIAHNFFIDNTFDNQNQINEKIEELLRIKEDLQNFTKIFAKITAKI